MEQSRPEAPAHGNLPSDGGLGGKENFQGKIKIRQRAKYYSLLAGNLFYQHIMIAGLGVYLLGYALGSIAPSWYEVVVLTLFIGVGVGTGWRIGLPRTALVIFTLLIVTGVWRAWLQPEQLQIPTNHLVRNIPDRATTLEGWVVEEPVSGRRIQRVRLRTEWLEVDSVRRLVTGDCLIRLRLQDAIAYGERLRLTGLLLSKPNGYANLGGFDYRAFLARRNIYVVGRLGGGGEVEKLPGIHPEASTIRLYVSRWRARMLSAIEQALPGGPGAVLEAIVLGARERLSVKTREEFRKTGTAHLLAISGLHVGFIAVAVFWSLRALLRIALRLPPELYGVRFAPSRWAALGTAPAVLFYALLVGGRVATVRATIMVLVYLSARICRKPRNNFHALALAAILILVWDPKAIGDVSFHLSFAAVTAILLALPSRERSNQSPTPPGETTVLRRLVRRMGLFILISVVASLATWPLIARSFHRIAVLGPLANALVIPLASLTIPLGLVAALCSLLFPATAQILFAPAGWGASMLLMILKTIARFPRASVVIAAPSWPALIAYYTLLACILAWPRTKRRGVLVLAACITFVGATTATALQNHQLASRLTITAFDAGRAQSVLLRLPDGRRLLWFGIPPRSSHFIVRRIVVPALLDQRIGVIHGLIAANSTEATAKGLLSLARAVSVQELWVAPRVDGTWPAPLRRAIEELDLPVQSLHAGWNQTCGDGCRLRILWPRLEVAKPPKTRNDDGPVLHVRFNRTSALLTGDSSFRVERALLQKPSSLRATMLQVPKAGSRFASIDPFLRTVAPEDAVLAARSPKSWEKDVEKTLARYRRLGIRLWRVNRDGAISWMTDGTRSVIHAARFNGGVSRRHHPSGARGHDRSR